MCIMTTPNQYPREVQHRVEGQEPLLSEDVMHAELLKGRILGPRIPDIFKENSVHFWLRPKLF